MDGFDGWAEAWDVEILPEIVDRIAEAKERAEALAGHQAPPVEIVIHGRPVVVMPHGAKGGVRFVIRDAHAIVGIAPNRRWGVTLRILSAGLWTLGLDGARATYGEWLRDISREADDGPGEPVVSRLDYCFDYHAPDFTPEAAPETIGRFLAPGHTHFTVHGAGLRTQTFTLGRMPGLQLQVYDKGAEIREFSGKDFFLDVWKQGADGKYPGVRSALDVELSPHRLLWQSSGLPSTAGEPIRDVWRIEVRFGGQFLKDRKLRRAGEVLDRLPEMLGAALVDRRLTEAVDGRRDLAATHPLFFDAWRRAGSPSTAPRLCDLVTMLPDEYRRIVEAGIEGSLMTLAVADDGEIDPDLVMYRARDLAGRIAQRDDLARQTARRAGRFPDWFTKGVAH